MRGEGRTLAADSGSHWLLHTHGYSHMHMTPQATDLSAINQNSILHLGLELLAAEAEI